MKLKAKKKIIFGSLEQLDGGTLNHQDQEPEENK